MLEKHLGRFDTKVKAYVDLRYANRAKVDEGEEQIQDKKGNTIVIEEIAITGRQRLSLLTGGEIPMGERQLAAGKEQFYLFRTNGHFALDYRHGYEGKTFCPHCCSFQTSSLPGKTAI
jgi:hypothetical protein